MYSPIPQSQHSLTSVHEGGVVTDQDYRIPRGMKCIEQIHNLAGCGGIQVTGGFIGEQNGRLSHERTGYGHPLLLPTGQLIGQVVHAVSHANGLQCFSRSITSIAVSHFAVHKWLHYVSQGCGSREKIEALKYESDIQIPHICLFVRR